MTVSPGEVGARGATSPEATQLEAMHAGRMAPRPLAIQGVGPCLTFSLKLPTGSVFGEQVDLYTPGGRGRPCSLQFNEYFAYLTKCFVILPTLLLLPLREDPKHAIFARGVERGI